VSAIGPGGAREARPDALLQIADNLRFLKSASGGSLVNLSMNENPEPPLELLQSPPLEALAQVHRYPIESAERLRQRLAALHELPADQVLVTNGATEAISFIPRALYGPHVRALLPDCTFTAYRSACAAAGLAVDEVPTELAGSSQSAARSELTALSRSVGPMTKLIFLANPNNPTGAYFTHGELAHFLSTLPPWVVVVLDEAYKDYAPELDLPDSAALRRQHRNLLVMRTFSKSYGIAALRVGYLLGDATLLGRLEKARDPFSGNLFGHAAALGLLEQPELLPRVVERNRARRALLTAALRELGLLVYPSAANFVLVDLPQRGEDFAQLLRARGILVRTLTDCGRPASLRISVGTEAEIERLRCEMSAILRAQVAR
jgi:histidinol-phosphate aminotransferase